MEITSNPTRALGGVQGTQTQEDAQAVLSSDFETFIKMLTVQMENQDPLNPVESTEFATQLAQFSSVEQQVLTNDLLTSLGAQIGAQSVAQLSNWVGLDATAVMPVNYTGEPVNIVTQATSFADAAQLVVRNQDGVEVARYDIETERNETSWLGLTSDGQQLPFETYQLDVESFSGAEVIDTSSALVEGRIIEARNENGQPFLVMNTGQQVESSNVVALREATVP